MKLLTILAFSTSALAQYNTCSNTARCDYQVNFTNKTFITLLSALLWPSLCVDSVYYFTYFEHKVFFLVAVYVLTIFAIMFYVS